MAYDISIRDEELETFKDVQQPSALKTQATESLKQTYQFIGYTDDGLAIYSI